MTRPLCILGVFGLLALGCPSDPSASGTSERRQLRTDSSSPGEAGVGDKAGVSDEEARRRQLEATFPFHALVTGIKLEVRQRPDPESPVIGWVRRGSRLRAKAQGQRTSTCASGWHQVNPRGWVCAGQGVEVASSPPQPEAVLGTANPEGVLPYDYWFVKETLVPQYHQLPSRDQQRAALAFTGRYKALKADDENRAENFLRLRGEMPGEKRAHPVVGRFLRWGFYVAGTGLEVRSRRRFVRTATGGYVKESQLEQRSGSSFQGWELSEERQLPVALLLRTARPLIKVERSDGTIRWENDEEATPLERHTLLESWLRRERVGSRFMHILDGDRYLRDWFVSVVRPIERPADIAENEPWVHVDLSDQSLVVYRGSTPVYVTLVSTGLEGHETPVGTFALHRKLISDTMANLGPDAGDDRYRIEDVPWTQYFEGSFALHGAFWHNRFGLRRSHGCVNLSPRDARRVFQETWPAIPEGWHGVATERTGFTPSHVHITP